MNRVLGAGAMEEDPATLSPLTYLLESGSDRIGALDFQTSPSEYVSRRSGTASLEELMQSAERVEQGIPLSPVLDAALLHASSVGGARLVERFDRLPEPDRRRAIVSALTIGPDGFRMSQVAGCVKAASTYLLSEVEAREIVDRQLDVIESQWSAVCDRARMTEVERRCFWRRQFLNPFAVEGYTLS